MEADTPPDVPMTFVTSETQGNLHVFLPQAFDLSLVETVAQNFSRRIQQPVKVFYDSYREKYRICPFPEGSTADMALYGSFCFDCDTSTKPPPSPERNQASPHIPRPRNSWILFRQHHCKGLKDKFPGIKASEISTITSSMWKDIPAPEKQRWQEMAQEEDRLHREKYPGYKYSANRSSAKKKQLNTANEPMSTAEAI